MRLAPLIATACAGFTWGCVERGDVLAPGAPGVATTLGAIDVALGDEHGCAVVAGRVHCWGDNGFGQLGSDGAESSTPRPVSLGAPALAVSAGAFHSCALDHLGRVYCWGDNRRGQLGVGDRTERRSPTLVALPGRAARVTTDFLHSCALLSDASLYCWGKNDEGELGQADAYPGDQSTAADALEPVLVAGSFRDVDTGQGHSCAVQIDGLLLCWGRNSEHELGPDERIQIREPVSPDPNADWLAVDAGQHHTCGLRRDRSLECWGQNTAYDEGLGAPLGIPGAGTLDTPTAVELARELSVFRTDTFHSCALDSAGGIHCWGRNTEGQLGLGDRELRDSPAFVDAGYATVAVGRFHTCAITTGGELFCAGKNDAGQLGVGDRLDRSELSLVGFAGP